MGIIIANTDPYDIDDQLQITQNRDERIVELREKLEVEADPDFVLENGLVYRKSKDGRSLFYVPKEMEINVIRHAHEKICHLGTTKCVDQLRAYYWFPNMKTKVENFIQNCIRCIMYSIPSHCHNRTLHSIPKKPIPFDTIHIDHFGPLPSILSKRKHILVVVDAFTKHTKLYAVNSTSSREVRACLDKYFENYSRPRKVISDRGACFTSLEFSSYLIDHNIEHVQVATASAQANGQVERVNRVLKSMLAKLSEPIQHSDWTKMLTRVEFALNNSVHSSTGHTPCQLLFGVSQRGLEVDMLTEHLEEKFETSDRDLTKSRTDASDRIIRSQQRNSTVVSRKHSPPVSYSEGEFVVIHSIDTTIGTNEKFVPKFRGPYRIHKVLPNDRYVIRDIENCQITQLPYDGIIEASRMRRWADWRDARDSDDDSASEN